MSFNNQVLKDILANTPLTHEALAKGAGISKSTLINYTKGITDPGIDALIKIADYLALPLDVLCGRCTQEQYDSVMADYPKRFMELRRAPYEAYILTKCHKQDFRFTDLSIRENDMDAPWPNNLIDHICLEPMNIIIEGDYEDGLNYALSTLKEPEREFLIYYYRDGYTLAKIGEICGKTRERVRQIIAKGLRKLRHPARRKYIIYGLKGADMVEEAKILKSQIEINNKVIEKQTELINRQEEKLMNGCYNAKDRNELAICMRMDATSIDELNLGVRAYNCMRRQGCETVMDVIKRLRAGEIHTIRNLGKKSAAEVVNRINDFCGESFEVEAVW